MFPGQQGANARLGFGCDASGSNFLRGLYISRGDRASHSDTENPISRPYTILCARARGTLTLTLL